MSSKILIITGLTATGKSQLAIDICKKIKGEIVSADSRQIYQKMDIGTGKDVGGAKFKLIEKIGNKHLGYYLVQTVPVWMMDVVQPSYQFSLADYIDCCQQVFAHIRKRGSRIVIVGGSGHYINGLLKPPQTLRIKPNWWLRKFANLLPTNTIEYIFSKLDSQTYKRLNNSEKHNRHRLIRKIEIKLARNNTSNSSNPPDWQTKIVYLESDKNTIDNRIGKRVEQRLKQGLVEEIDSLRREYGFDSPGMNCLAYKEFKPYFLDKDNIDNCVARWLRDEIHYAKRQKTWFKNKNFQTVNVANYDRDKLINQLVKWYNQ